MSKQKTTLIRIGAPDDKSLPKYRVEVSDAKNEAVINGSVASALTGHRGQTVGCALSNASTENPTAFKHPCHYASFTKSMAYIVDKVKEVPDGKGGIIKVPVHAVKYRHGYGRIVDLNDTGKLKVLAEAHPEAMEREFILKPPSKSKPNEDRIPKPRHRRSGISTPRVPLKGALRRAKMAGLRTEVDEMADA